MATFSYKAIDGQGQNVSGTLVAETQQAALNMLNDRTLFPVNVLEGGKADKPAFLGGRSKVKTRHLTVFYGQLADLLKAGVPVLRSLDVLAKQTSNPTLAEVIKEVREDVAGGASLADSFTKHGHVFSELYVSMVRAGEHGGFIEDVLTRIAQFTERQDELRNKLVGSMIYPSILVGGGTTLIILLLTLVVPELRPFIENAEPNIMTLAVFAVSDILQGYGLWIAAVAAIAITSFAGFARTDTGRMRIDYWKLKVPLLGKTLIMIALCRFCRILGTMLRSGVPILQALRISRDSAGNEILAKEIDKATDNVQKGGLISEPLSNCELFPLDIVDMIAVAEESNSLDTILVQIADTNEIRTARMIDLGMRLIEPILLVIMAGVIAMIAIALLVPILTLSSNF
jgi:general secretion pathway protein F/type IV pilus assembly protein PilC